MRAAATSNTGKQGSSVSFEPAETTVSIDWLSLVGTPTDEFLGWAEENQNVRIYKSTWNLTQDSWNVPSRGYFVQSEGAHFEAGKMAWRFNPNNVDLAFVREVLSRYFVCERVSRIDVAIDINEDLADVLIDVPRRGKNMIMTAGGRLETVSFGT